MYLSFSSSSSSLSFSFLHSVFFSFLHSVFFSFLPSVFLLPSLGNSIRFSVVSSNQRGRTHRGTKCTHPCTKQASLSAVRARLHRQLSFSHNSARLSLRPMFSGCEYRQLFFHQVTNTLKLDLFYDLPLHDSHTMQIS